VGTRVGGKVEYMDMGVDKDFTVVYRTAFAASIVMLVIIPLQIVVFLVVPIPGSVHEWFLLFQSNWVLGMFHADLFILVNNILIALIYLAMYQSLKTGNRGLLQIALLFGFLGIAGYIASNKTFELLSLSSQYAAAVVETDKAMILAAGKAMIATWQGTAFDVYYVLNGFALLLIAFAMTKSKTYGRATAVFGLVAGFFMMVPSTAGSIGLAFSLLSLLPWYVFAIRFAIVFRKLGRQV